METITFDTTNVPEAYEDRAVSILQGCASAMMFIPGVIIRMEDDEGVDSVSSGDVRIE